jgi:hypothetical protein
MNATMMPARAANSKGMVETAPWGKTNLLHYET